MSGPPSARIHTCPGCGYGYDERAGDPREGFAPGTPWAEVPDDWPCPDCGVREKVDFEPATAPVEVTAENDAVDRRG